MVALEIREAIWLNYTLAPVITIMVFDWLLTLDLEVLLVWNSPWSGMKVLFLLVRYSPFIDVPALMYFQLGYALPQHTCKTIYTYVAWGFMIFPGLAMVMLTNRTWAVRGRGKKSGCALFGMFGLVWASGFVLDGLYLGSSTFRASDFPELVGCTLQAKGSYLVAIYVLLMFYEGGLLLLMLSQGISAFREGGNSKLAKIIYRDGVLYYIYIFGLSLINTVVILRLQGVYMTLLLPMERVIYSILACRAILHIREQVWGEALLSQQTSPGTLRFAGRDTDDFVLNEVSGEPDDRV